MRILYMQPAARFGGAERQAATIIPLLQEFGLEVTTLGGPGPIFRQWLSERGVKKFELSRNFPQDWRGSVGLSRWSRPLQYARCALAIGADIERVVRNQRIELILAAMPFSWIAATPVARKLGLPIVWRAGGNDINRFEAAALSAVCRLGRPDLLLCNGYHVASTYARLVSAPCMVVHNGVDPSYFHVDAGCADRYRPASARMVVGFAGRLVPQKRPQDFIAMAARLTARYPDVVCLLGGDSPLRSHYESLAKHESPDAVRFIGFVDDMQSFYAACDVFVLPSDSEGCPNVLLEAMACKTAVVASNIRSVREVIRDGVEGLLVPLGDIDGLVTAVARLIDNQVGMRGMAERGYQCVTRRFLAQHCAQRIADSLWSCAAGSPAFMERAIYTGPVPNQSLI